MKVSICDLLELFFIPTRFKYMAGVLSSQIEHLKNKLGNETLSLRFIVQLSIFLNIPFIVNNLSSILKTKHIVTEIATNTIPKLFGIARENYLVPLFCEKTLNSGVLLTDSKINKYLNFVLEA